MNRLHLQKKRYGQIALICLLCLCCSLCACGKKTKTIDDGNYVASVTISGGSGRATVEDTATVKIENGIIYTTIRWSSPNYDYMIVDDIKYLNEAEFGENSVFTFPIKGFEEEISVIGDTTAMSVPHEIEYTLTFTLVETDFSEIVWQEEMKLSYATQFSVQKNREFALITIADGGRILLVKEGFQVPLNLPKDVCVIKQPLNQIYLVSSSVVDLIRELDELSSVRFIGISEENLYIDEAKEALINNEILYAGKYSAPDYELLMKEGCDLAIENTMIYHNPQTKEKLEELGIPVFVERSSYEEHPLGRLEWIKLYGLLMGKEEEADAFFEEQLQCIGPILNQDHTGITVAYFYINSNGVVNIRKPNDYISKMIQLAGGNYVFQNLQVEEDNALSTMNMQMEDFYVTAKDADVLIYNSTIDGELTCSQDLIDKNPLFADFAAVKSGQVYCTSKDFFQESTGIVSFMEDLHWVFTGADGEFHFLKQL